MRLHSISALLAALSGIAGSSLRAQTESDGIVAIEAESFVSNLSPRSAHQWDAVPTLAGFSGSGYIEATPNNGANLTSGTASPETQYSVNFTTTGVYYVWIRGHAASGSDDSVHVGVDGAGSVPVTLSQYNQWQWSNTNFTTGLAATINIGAAGNRTINVWMREDGMRVDRIILTTNPAFQPTTGNSWHIATNAEPAGVTGMRSPLKPLANQAVTFYSGNQYQGSGNPGNQAQINSALFYRKIGDTNWTGAPMNFHSQAANNKYFSVTLPGGLFASGDVVQYYLRIWYTDHLPTFLFGGDFGSAGSELEADARANPFVFSVPWPLQPSGTTQAWTSGSFQARIYPDSGHFEVAGPDLNGSPLANVIALAPPWARVAGRDYQIGRVLSTSPLANGFAMVQQLGSGTVSSCIVFPHDAVARYEVTDWNGVVPERTWISAASGTTERFYGFGEKFNAFDQSGLRVRMRTFDQPGTKGDDSYKVAPWFVSTRGYGFHLDSTAESFFDMRATEPDRYTIENLFPSLAVQIVGGPRFADVMKHYTGYTGRPPLPPAWAFGTWISSDIWRTGGEVRYAVTKFIEHGIPASVFVFDSPWETAYNDFNWNMAQWGTSGTYEGVNYPGFSSVSDMMNFLRSHGLKVICWMTPFVNISSFDEPVPGDNTGQASNYAEGAANGYFVRSSPGGPPLVVPWWKGQGSPVDFTNPAARDWITAQIEDLIEESKAGGSEPVIGGFKTDDGETANNVDTYIPTTASYFDGRTGIEMRNGFCVEYHKTIWNILGNDGLLFARSGFTGTHAFPAYWGGDNQPNFGAGNGLQSVIVSAQSAAMSGYSIWGHDIGGYLSGGFESSPENLFMRWTQFGAFSPLMQIHRQVDGSNLRQYPWGYGAAALDNYRTYAKLHVRLFPYIYSYAKQSVDSGLPIIRPLVLKHQEDVNTHSIRHTFYFGDELLVAPVITLNSTSRNVYLPAGQWRDFWTNASHTGGQNVNWSNVDVTKFPVFVKEGAIIPMLATDPQTLCTPGYVGNPSITTAGTGLLFLLYPGATPSAFELYDGTDAASSTIGTVTSFTVNSVARDIQIRSLSTSPVGVERNGVRLPMFTTEAEFNSASLGWRYDGAEQKLHVKFPHSGGVAFVNWGPDTVGDGITDSWRQFFGAGSGDEDADGDGKTAEEEYLAGTDPNDSGSVFVSDVVPGPSGGAAISWQSQVGIRYRVEWRNDLLDGTWQAISPDFTGDGGVLSWTDDGSQTGGLAAAKRFYRVSALE